MAARFFRTTGVISERDKEIYRQYVDDQKTLHELGVQFGLTRERIRQIIRKIDAGAYKHTVTVRSMQRAEKSVTRLREVAESKHGTFLGVNVRPSVKDQIVDEAKERGISVSALVDEKLSRLDPAM